MQQTELKNINVSRFQTLLDSSARTNILDELDLIRTGGYQDKILEARFYYKKDKVRYNQLKKKLPAVTFSAEFKTRRLIPDLQFYSGFLVLDIDNLANNVDINTIKEQLFIHDHVCAVWISPSGVGLKALISTGTPMEYHKYVFNYFVELFKVKHDVVVDVSGSDITRLCFSSFDEKMLLKETFSSFSEDLLVDVNKDIPVSQIGTVVHIDQQALTISEKLLLNDPKGRNSSADRLTMHSILNFLKRRRISITSTYEEWYRIALAIANSFTYDVGVKYFLDLCRLDLENHDEEGSVSMLQYCYIHRRLNGINFGTIVFFAQQKGFQLNYRNSNK
ncbi:MAG: hypothetical protein JO301_13695 [Chitinophagaceae bacterium]|nr:hypothetical protein [Chitinophagaceae bacterium]